MRVAMIVVAIALASSPAQASPSCMTQSEARQKFPNAHLWWHGPNRCWDATASRTQLGKSIKAKETGKETGKETRPAAREELAERETPPDKTAQEKTTPAKKPPYWAHEGRWREAMSRMLPEDEPRVETPARAEVSSTRENPRPAPTAPQMNWRDRWIDVSPSAKRS